MTTIVIFLLLIPLYLQANSQDLSPDRAILLSLKQHWGNPPSLSSWNSSSFHCDWPGVECTSGAITALHLAAKELSETIPSSIGQLNDIITVDTVGYVHEFIQWDNARGNVPNASTALSAAKLQRNIWSTALDLSNNQLSGNVVESIFHLRSKNLWLCSNNFFEKIPFELLDHHYKSKCLDRSNLCSDYSADGLASCPTSLCSDHRIKAFLKCGSKDDKSRRYFVITIVETAGCGAVGFAILYYLARKCWLKKHETIVARCKKFWSCGSSRVFINQASTTIAVKSISNARKSDHRLEKEFLAEVQTLGTIRHNNIVKLFCCISGKELKLLVYQYFENKSLDQWLHGNKREISSVGSSSVTRLDWPMRLHVAIGAAQGLCYMHHDCSPLLGQS